MNNNVENLKSFTDYCFEHKDQRFWQALRNWNQIENPKESFILVSDTYSPIPSVEDTFYRE